MTVTLRLHDEMKLLRALADYLDQELSFWLPWEFPGQLKGRG